MFFPTCIFIISALKSLAGGGGGSSEKKINENLYRLFLEPIVEKEL